MKLTYLQLLQLSQSAGRCPQPLKLIKNHQVKVYSVVSENGYLRTTDETYLVLFQPAAGPSS